MYEPSPPASTRRQPRESTINGAAGSSIQTANLDTIAATDPLWPPNSGVPCTPSSTFKRAGKNARSSVHGKLPTYAQARLIADAVRKTLPKSALDRIAARIAARVQVKK